MHQKKTHVPSPHLKCSGTRANSQSVQCTERKPIERRLGAHSRRGHEKYQSEAWGKLNKINV